MRTLIILSLAVTLLITVGWRSGTDKNLLQIITLNCQNDDVTDTLTARVVQTMILTNLSECDSTLLSKHDTIFIATSWQPLKWQLLSETFKLVVKDSSHTLYFTNQLDILRIVGANGSVLLIGGTQATGKKQNEIAINYSVLSVENSKINIEILGIKKATYKSNKYNLEVSTGIIDCY